MSSLAERGLKHTCSVCETRFFDMGRQPATCPKCQHKAPAPAPAPVSSGRRVRRNADERAIETVTATSALPGSKPAPYKPVKWKKGFSG